MTAVFPQKARRLRVALPNLIYDRTQADADRWLYLSQKLDTLGFGGLTAQEQAEWLTDIKGGYNHTDLNRVGNAVAYLGGRFIDLVQHLIDYRAEYGVASDPLMTQPYKLKDVKVQPKTDWQRGNYMYVSQAARYLADLTTLRSLLPLTSEFPAVPPDMVDLTLDEANDIEKLLSMLDTELTRITDVLETYIRDTAAAWFYSGDLYGGEI